MRSLWLIVLLSILGFTVESFSQWPLACQPAGQRGGVITLRSTGRTSYFYRFDTASHFQVLADPAGDSTVFNYQLGGNETTTNYRTAVSTGIDLTADGVFEVILNFQSSDGTTTFVKVINPVDGSTLLDRRIAGRYITLRPEWIADFDGDGQIECLVEILNWNTGSTTYEVYDTGVATDLQLSRTKTRSFELKGNYPNPFNADTRISYAIDRSGLVAIRIYNVVGQFVTELNGSWQTAGAHEAAWDGKSIAGDQVSSGSYAYEVLLDGKPLGSQRMVLLR
jgi:hypothetical protein